MFEYSFNLEDCESSEKTLPVEILCDGNLLIRPKGTGDKVSLVDQGYPIMLEYYQGSVRLLVWGDINQEDPTHIIPLDGAMESKRVSIDN